ncbi:MAG: hypothetical protein WBQ73_02780 [Candidatus Babeliales bacterium]
MKKITKRRSLFQQLFFIGFACIGWQGVAVTSNTADSEIKVEYYFRPEREQVDIVIRGVELKERSIVPFYYSQARPKCIEAFDIEARKMYRGV